MSVCVCVGGGSMSEPVHPPLYCMYMYGRIDRFRPLLGDCTLTFLFLFLLRLILRIFMIFRFN